MIGANLITPAMAPLTAASGGTSKGNAGAGTNPSVPPGGSSAKEITTADRAGAGILTVVMIFIVVGGCWWLCI